MKPKARRFAGIAICACMLFSSIAVHMPDSPTVITASAAYDVGSYLDKDDSWYSTNEAISVADEIVKYQLSDGGWRKDMTNTSVSGSWAKSTIDNEATWGQIRVLARVYNATGNEKYKTACLKGIDLLISGQYENGGWPQVFNDTGTYHAHITYNDTAMVSVLRVLLEAANKSGDFPFIDSTRQQQAQKAVDKGVECILNTQITVNDTLTAWCQQHDEYTLEPTSARAYELPSLSSSESVGIVDFLRSLPDPDARVIRSINAAVRWFDAVKIENIKFDWNSDRTDKVVTTVNGSTLWARFYEIGTNRPMFSDRDGQVYYDVSEISQERRTGYAWYGTWPAKNVALGTLPEPEEEPETATPISGNLIQALVPETNALPDLWKIDTDLQLGDLIYTDREGVTYAEVPEALLGAEAVVTPCDAKKIDADLAQLTAKEDITVFVVLDSRVTAPPAWLSDWNTTGETITNSDGVVYDLYSKEIKAEETLTLGTNGQTSGCTGYAFIAAPAGTKLSVAVQGGIPGDANCDQNVNAFDLALMKRHLIKGDILSESGYACADVNGDREVTVVDIVHFQKWLLGGDSVLMSYGAAEIPTEPETVNFLN